MLTQQRPDWIRTLQTSTIPYFAVTLAENADSHAVDERVPWIIFREGRIHVGDFVIQAPDFRGDSVAWRQTSQLGFTSGHLYYGRQGAELQGFVSMGSSQDTAEIFQVIATAAPFGPFRTTLTEPGGEPVEGPIIRLGYRPERRMAVEPAVVVNEEDVSRNFVFSLDGEDPALTIDLTDDDKWGSLRGLVRLRFHIDPATGIELNGTITRIGEDDKVRTLSVMGELFSSEASLEEPQAVRLIYTGTDLPSFEAALEAEDPLTNEEVKGFYSCLAAVPDDTELGQRTFQYMQDNMHWAMHQDSQADPIRSRRKWLEMYYSLAEPDISEVRKASIRKHLSWYNDTMAVALMAQGVAGTSFDKKVVPNPILDADKRTINTYVQKCLAQSDVFQEESELVWRDAYLKASTGLKKYVDEDERTRDRIKAGDTARRTWASRVREYFTTPEQLQIITTALFAEAKLRPGEETGPGSVEELAGKIAEVTKRLEGSIKRVQELKRANADQQAVADAEALVQAQQDLIDMYKLQQKTLSLTICKATATIKNVSSLLKALDPSGESAQVYADRASSAVLATTAAHADLAAIPDYGATLEKMMEKFLVDLTEGRLNIFDHAMNEQLAGQMRALMAQERLNARSLASKMNTVLSNARGQTFMERADQAARSFATEHPTLTVVFRFAMIAAYAYTVVRVFQLLGKDAGNVSALDQATFYTTMSMLSVETIRSLIPNVSAFIDTTKELLTGATPGTLAEWWGRFRSWTGDLMSRMGACLARIGSGLGNLAARVAEAAAVKWLGSVVKSAFSAMTRMAGNAISAVGGAIGRLATRFADWFRKTFTGFCKLIGKALEVVSKVLTVAAVLWSTITEGIACVKLWMSDRQLGAKILTTVGLIATAAAGVATIVGVFSTQFAWSGVGVVLGLIAFGIAVLVQLIWKEKSPLQKLIEQVLVPFIQQTAAPAVHKVEELAATGA